jgi:hypothetical protein
MKIKFKGHDKASAYAIVETDSVKLISYTTLVAQVTRDGWLEVYGLYSRTTIKHIGWFMREYCGLDYYTAKYCVEHGVRMNIYTGEIIPR